ncbi:MAG: 30S ribosomal protein S5 [Candidatus Yanofskybacteria bacterium RIFCSPLOWO2_01_FULL_49_25]|uniref:Small ribosomal subunit protein uS5 n=1 Tax=Candidatus Yanofskybacteria bacterium RIFCSPLOWO2_01_FULL_49_25 TaxID=1802701 RepID=A0A1F8GUT8_9BACT|nr:MAG: 30S ribosomal protein S5 [Candidatus Yanofskybacteria bacterium RIFCSPLOWO2_01_FULL_49_25]
MGGRPKEKQEFDSRLIDLARVSRVTKGGKRFSFRATVVLGDGKGRVGIGTAQGRDVAQAMQKATQKGRKNIIRVTAVKGTIPHEVLYKYHSAVVLLKPAPIGNGVKAGGPVRIIAKLAGIENITAKLIERTGNKLNIARATIKALSELKYKETPIQQNNADTQSTTNS